MHARREILELFPGNFVDVRHGLTTGISAEERTNTVRALANGNSGAADFVRPGHVFPLVAKEGGVLMRSGHTEGCIDLCRLAGLPAVGVLSELMNDDGTVMKGEQVARFAATHKLKHVTIADMIAYRQAREKLIERVATFTTESPIGPLQGYAYRSPFDEIAHAAFVYNGIGDGRNVLTRFHKPNIVKDIFTGPKRMQAVLEHFRKAGSGVLVYLRDGAAGVPVEPVGEQKSAEADRNRQWREVGVGAQILRDLGVTSIRHLTSSVHDYKGLSGFGGSEERTSSAAPAMPPPFNAAARSFSFTSGPRAVVITKLDHARANYQNSILTAQNAFGDKVLPLYLPAGSGLIGLLSQTHYEYQGGKRTTHSPDPSYADQIEEALPLLRRAMQLTGP